MTIVVEGREMTLCGAETNTHAIAFYCTRSLGHDGDHIAAIGPWEPGGAPILATWPQSAAATVLDNTRNPPEAIELHAHVGVCRYCDDGIVKMLRDPVTLALEPDRCICLRCGQPYYVVLTGPIEEWEQQQWAEKRDRDLS